MAHQGTLSPDDRATAAALTPLTSLDERSAATERQMQERSRRMSGGSRRATRPLRAGDSGPPTPRR
jgi:hypothetical protein